MINRTIGPYVVGIQRIAEGVINEAQNAAMGASLKRGEKRDATLFLPGALP
jgi:hypothetical protein